MELTIETVTPEWAKFALGTANAGNRNLRPRVVTRIAEDIRNGDWQVNGETIKFTDDFHLVDGQHRLAAIVEADTAVQAAIAFGVPADHQVTVDTGAARVLGDVLKLRGETNCNTLASAARLGYLLDTEGVAASAVSPSNQQVIRWLDENSSIKEFSTGRSYSSNPRAWTAKAPKSKVMALDYLFSRDCDPILSEAFWMSVLQGEGEDMYEGNPAFTLRRHLLHAGQSRRRSLPAQLLVAIIIKAWAAYQAGETVKILRWVPRYENRRIANFPTWRPEFMEEECQTSVFSHPTLISID